MTSDEMKTISLVTCHYLPVTDFVAESEGLEPSSPFGRQFSRLLPYQLGELSEVVIERAQALYAVFKDDRFLRRSRKKACNCALASDPSTPPVHSIL